MRAIVCAHHADRAALWYCSGCGRPLCGACVVRLSSGNYCEACAEAPDHRPPAPRAPRSRVWLWIGIAALAAAAYVITRML
jgi:hypothetical protein